MGKIWANSGDSHLVEPGDLFTRSLPADLAERMPRSVKDDDGGFETVYVDGQEFRRRMPKRQLVDPETGLTVDERAPGANDAHLRLKDLDDEGIWAELVFPSIGIWTSSVLDPSLLREGMKAINDWAITYQDVSPRYVCTASIPLLDVDDAAAEVRRCAGLGFHAAFLPVSPPPTGPGDFNLSVWDPVWEALEESSMVCAFHIGTEPHDASVGNGVYYRGAGGALLNYMETTYGGQRAAAKMIASGVFDRFPELKVMVSEGGATWGPFIADRLDEAYRQHNSAVRPQLQKLPSEYLYGNVYASFQHDRSAVYACTAMGWRNVCWGSDYPHIEGTYGHTQKTLHELFDDVAPVDRRRMTVGAFQEMFPHIPDAPADEEGSERDVGKLDGKTAIVTGASRGIGKQLAVALAREGANVVVASRTVDAHRRLPGTIGDTLAALEAVGGKGIAVRTDLTVPADITRLAAEAVAAFGGIDVLINNAADTSGGTPRLRDLDVEDWRRQFEANVHGPLQLIQAVVPELAKRGGGTIVNLTSGAGDLVAFDASASGTSSVLGGERLAYASSKAALNRLANALAPELAAEGISIVNVDPGFTRTELVDLMGERGVVDPEAAVPMEVPVTAVLHLVTTDDAARRHGSIVRAAAFVAELQLPLVPGTR